MNNVLGVIAPDPIGKQLGTGYERFSSSCGIDGLAKVNGYRLDVLAVINPTGRPGRFRLFITLCKVEFDTICIWNITNPIVAGALTRYGFTAEVEITNLGEAIEGMRWDKKLVHQTKP